MPGPVGPCHLLPAPVLSPRAQSGTPTSCPHPHAHCGEDVPLPTASLRLRGASQGGSALHVMLFLDALIGFQGLMLQLGPRIATHFEGH
jgi:hypothetical protein